MYVVKFNEPMLRGCKSAIAIISARALGIDEELFLQFVVFNLQRVPLLRKLQVLLFSLPDTPATCTNCKLLLQVDDVSLRLIRLLQEYQVLLFHFLCVTGEFLLFLTEPHDFANGLKIFKNRCLHNNTMWFDTQI